MSQRRLAVFAVLALIVVVPFAACGGNSATAPSAPAASVVPFALVGGVFDTARTPLAQARVEVVNGPQKGTAVMTDDAGAFAFGKIFTAPFTLRASKDGRRDQSRQISNAQSDGVFTLAIELAGNYQVVFAADAACTTLPAGARTRTYLASFESRGDPFYIGTLSGADFARTQSYPGFDVIYAKVSAESGYLYFNDPEIWEHLSRDANRSPQADLVILGEATGTLGPDTSHWSVSGTFSYCPAPEPDDYPECTVPVIRCQSRNHQLTLTRTR